MMISARSEERPLMRWRSSKVLEVISFTIQKIFGRQVVIMQFGSGYCASLVDFRKVSDSSSDSYDWKRRVREPGDFIELGLNEFFHFSKL